MTGDRALRSLVVAFVMLCSLPPLADSASAATTELISMSRTRELGVLDSQGAAVSADGRYVAFMSDANNLVPEAAGYDRIYLRDRRQGTLQLVDRDPHAGGTASFPSISEDGRHVAFMLWSSAYRHVFVRDLETGERECVSVSTSGEEGDAASFGPTSISADGRYVVFYSDATNLVSDDTNGEQDVFVRDRLAGTTERVSLSSSEEEGDDNSFVWPGAVSADGRYVAFTSVATNMVPGVSSGLHVYVRDRVDERTECVDGSGGSEAECATISADGRHVAFFSNSPDLVPDDTNGVGDIFVCDRQTGTVERVSVSSSGDEGNDESRYPAISGDGRHVVFCSPATNLVPQDASLWWDVFVHDRETRTTERVSLTSTGEPGEGHSGVWPYGPAVSADGRHVVFQSGAANLFPGDTNARADVFLRDRSGLYDVGPGHWAYRHILACFHAGIVSGYADGSYQSLVPVNRGQMAVYVSRALAGGEGALPPGPDTPSFPDVPLDHWAYKHIEYAHLQYVVQGYEDGLYHPENEVDRGQMAVYIARSVVDPTGDEGLIGYDPPPTPTFPDVPSSFWSYKHVEYCVEHGVVQGYEDGYYHPEYVVTRDQMAVYVARAFGLL